MRCLVYAVLRDEPVLDPAPQGVGGAAVVLERRDGLAAAWSPAPAGFSRPEVQDLLAFAGVIEALHRQTSVLPFRFGCLLDGETAVGDLLRLRRDEFGGALQDLGGCVEVTVRVLPGDGGPGDGANLPEPSALSNASFPLNGTAYLAARRAQLAVEDAQRRWGEAAGDRLGQALGGFARRFATDLPGRPMALPACHYLVHREELPHFIDACQRLRAAGGVKLLLTGPWPPYHFAASAQGRDHRDSR